MYVCMYRGRPSWSCPWNRAIQLGLGEGPIGIVGPMSQPRGYHWFRVMHADMHSHSIVCFQYQLYSRQLRVTRILVCRGAVSHRTWYLYIRVLGLAWAALCIYSGIEKTSKVLCLTLIKLLSIPTRDIF